MQLVDTVVCISEGIPVEVVVADLDHHNKRPIVLPPPPTLGRLPDRSALQKALLDFYRCEERVIALRETEKTIHQFIATSMQKIKAKKQCASIRNTHTNRNTHTHKQAYPRQMLRLD
eukprot:GHVR01083084.1.p1 GENE.GHVR01083084.1~~GHVR01083084.1.p1  ORF type:complete len:117 (+),score=30.90 GHVR01083084.1:82-432(+)